MGRQCHYNAGQWTTAPLISSPAGGAVIDVEARDALAAIYEIDWNVRNLSLQARGSKPKYQISTIMATF